MSEPTSALTRERPHLWGRALSMATAVTGYRYEDKKPLADGTVWACGGGVPWEDLTLEDRIDQAEREVEIRRESGRDTFYWEMILDRLKEKKRDGEQKAGAIVWVPDDALDWLLHEVGHYLAATPAERTQRGYGISIEATIHAEDHRHQNHAADREWQAWAFQEIVLAPFGYARELTPPSYRGGVGYQRPGPIDSRHIDHIGKQLRGRGVDVEPWRLLAGEWVKWGKSRGAGHAPWESES